MRVILADDEPLARERMRTLLSRAPDVDIVGEAGDGEAVVDLCRDLPADALFLDIRMPGLSGLDVADVLRGQAAKPAIVFVSAYDEHALEAFNLEVLDYLTKPVRPSRLEQTLARIRGLKAAPEVREAESGGEKLGVPSGGKTLFVTRGQILHATVANGLVDLVCDDRTYHLSWTLKQLEHKLAGDARFEKVSRQGLVNLDRVRAMEPGVSGTARLILDNNMRVDISRNAAKKLRTRFDT